MRAPIPSAVAKAYDAPFPEAKYTMAVRAMPSEVPTLPTSPSLEAQRLAWEFFEGFEKPFVCAFTDNDPITILTNGRKSGGRYNKFIIEDINDDLSSIWLGSSQKIKLKPAQTGIGGADNPSSFSKPSIYLNSDRIFLNAKKENVIIAAKKDIINATPGWQMEMDKLFTLIEKLASELKDLTSAKATYATGVGPTGPATNASKVASILSDIKAMKQ